MVLIMYIFYQSPEGNSPSVSKAVTGQQQHCQLKPAFPVYEEIGLPIPCSRIGNEPINLTINAAYGKI